MSYGSGFITILLYGLYGEAVEESKALITEDGADNIWTETSSDILIET